MPAVSGPVTALPAVAATVNGKIFENPGRLLSSDSALRGINRQ